MDRIDIEGAVISMQDVALCIKLVDDMIEDGTKNQQVQAVQILEDIFRARYNALTASIYPNQASLKTAF